MADSFGNFDSDFEKLSSADDEVLVSSSTGTSQPFEFEGVEDLKTDVTTPKDAPVDAAEFDQLIDFGEATEPAFGEADEPTFGEAVEPSVAFPTESASLPTVDLSGDGHIPSEPLSEVQTQVPLSSYNSVTEEPQEEKSSNSVTEEPHEQKQLPVDSTTSESEDSCEWLENVDSRVLDLVYWRDVKKTGAIFACTLTLLLSLALFSIISVVAYTSLIVLIITIGFRLYKTAMGTVQKGGDDHPFKAYLENEITLPNEKVHEYADIIVKLSTDLLNTFRHIILIDDVVGSLKFGLLLWVLTYIGAWFNGMTLIILADVSLFTLPKVYDTYRDPINKNVDVARVKIQDLQKIVQEKVPFLGKTKQA